MYYNLVGFFCGEGIIKVICGWFLWTYARGCCYNKPAVLVDRGKPCPYVYIFK